MLEPGHGATLSSQLDYLCCQGEVACCRARTGCPLAALPVVTTTDLPPWPLAPVLCQMLEVELELLWHGTQWQLLQL